MLRIVSTMGLFVVVKAAQDNNRNLAYGAVTGQLVLGFTSQIFRNKSITELDRAMQIRNREVLFPGR